MNIYQRKTNKNLSTFPLFNELTVSLQDTIKMTIDRELLKRFLQRRITPDTLEQYSEILDINSDMYNVVSNRKYLFDLVMIILYEEILSLSEIKEVLAENLPLETLEEMVILEYELFSLPQSSGSEVTTDIFYRKYVSDYIVELKYKSVNYKSYASIGNIKDELEKIADKVFEDTETTKDELEEFLGAFNPTDFIRINGKASVLESTDLLSKVMFLLNYNSTSTVLDRSFYRKSKALAEGISVVGKEYFGPDYSGYIESYGYFGYFTGSHDPTLEKLHKFVEKFLTKIKSGTVNYEI